MTIATEITALPKAAEAVARIEALDWQEIGKRLWGQATNSLSTKQLDHKKRAALKS